MMPTTVTSDPAALAASVAHWWALAGMDVAVQDAPRDWLTKTPPAALPLREPFIAEPVVAKPSAAASPVSTRTIAPPMPDDLDAFQTWLANDPTQPEGAFSQARVLPSVIPSPDVLIITDMPTQEDMAAGHLFSSADAKLLGAMLRAIGIPMDRAALVSLLLARPAGGIMEDSIMRPATERLQHFVKLIGPRAIILLGDKTSRAFEQTNGSGDGLSTPAINLDDGTVSVLPLPAPFVLLRHPERKAAAWAQLRQLAKR